MSDLPEIPMREATAEEARAMMVSATKFFRKHSIWLFSIIALNVTMASFNAWNCARLLYSDHRGFTPLSAAASLISVYAAGKLVPTFLRMFRMWQMHCLMLESLFPPPTDRP